MRRQQGRQAGSGWQRLAARTCAVEVEQVGQPAQHALLHTGAAPAAGSRRSRSSRRMHMAGWWCVSPDPLGRSCLPWRGWRQQLGPSPEPKVVQAAVEQRAGAAAVHAAVKGHRNQLLAPPAAAGEAEPRVNVMCVGVQPCDCTPPGGSAKMSASTTQLARPVMAAEPERASSAGWNMPAAPT